MSDDYLWDRSGPRDPDVEKLEKLLAPLAHDAPLDQLRLRRKRPRWIVLGVVLAAAAFAGWLAIPSSHHEELVACTQDGSGFRFVAEGGAVACGGRQIATGVLPVGGVLDTGLHQVDLSIADIGTAQLGPNTRVSLDRSTTAGHHLSIDHGHMHARVAAPPRLFAISTKHAEVTDLGCEYTIDVDASGAGSLHVLSGKVELATKSGAIVVAPAGTHTKILAGQAPGLPLRDAGDVAFEAAIDGYLAGDPSAFDTVLALASPADAITLIDLAIIDAPHRPAVLAKLGQLAPPPEGVTIDGAAANQHQLERWREAIMITRFMSHSVPSPKSGKQMK
ncbi:MAG: hypothetical protein JWO36_583 [Myxococcales bacterium]|nr:hypothetical protein [Myxococcales bacterium]